MVISFWLIKEIQTRKLHTTKCHAKHLLSHKKNHTSIQEEYKILDTGIMNRCCERESQEEGRDSKAGVKCNDDAHTRGLRSDKSGEELMITVMVEYSNTLKPTHF